MSAPAGWYDDGNGRHRWWDGQTWTEHTRDVAPQRPETAPAEYKTAADAENRAKIANHAPRETGMFR